MRRISPWGSGDSVDVFISWKQTSRFHLAVPTVLPSLHLGIYAVREGHVVARGEEGATLKPSKYMLDLRNSLQPGFCRRF